jgi:long-subunit acyl-CoA synthetase (AMP-forming)
VLKVCPLRDDEVIASYLPLSHIAEQMVSIYVAVSCGACIYFAGGIDNLLETLLAARPTVFLAVPRVWEKLQVKIAEKLAAASPIQRRVIAWARDVGTRSGSYRLESGTPYGLLLLEEKLAAKLLFTKIKSSLGLERVRLSLSSAAAIRKDVLEFFLSLQMPIREVYGLSECTGPMTLNGPQGGKSRLGSVGRVIPGGMLKLAPDGEILYQGPNLFAGYFKDDQSTGAALHGGWLHSGDIGELDGDGFLRITDRKKDLFKTSGGRYVAPTPIEGALRTIPIISQAMVVGENRRYIVALLTIDAERGRAFAREHDLPESLDGLVAHEKVRSYLQEHIDRLNRSKERVETVKRFTLLARDFTVESDEMTPTQKLRRQVILARYAKDIDAMYDDEDRDDSKIG